MTNKKGFTLIELLAVIVILAVIALIATPIIMGVINDAKKGAAKDSMYSYVKAVELDATKNMQPDVDLLSGEFTVVDGNLYLGNSKILDINLKGTKPTNREGFITIQSGKVINAMLEFDGYNIGYDGNKADVSTYKVGDIIYFDPTGLISDCKSGKEWTSTNTSTTCYKWNVIKDNGGNIEMLLDHNLGNKVAWITKEDFIAVGGTEAEYGSNGNNKYGPITAIKQLKNDTSSWSKVEPFTSSDNIVRETINGITYIINYSEMRARLIGGQEIANIAGNIIWKPDSTAIPITEFPWIYQNLNSLGTDVQPLGYWIDSADSSTLSNAWFVNHPGSLNGYYVSHIKHGIRPVVRVLKSSI